MSKSSFTSTKRGRGRGKGFRHAEVRGNNSFEVDLMWDS